MQYLSKDWSKTSFTQFEREFVGMRGLAWGLEAFPWLLTSSAFSPYSSFTQFEREFVGVGGLTWGCGHIGLESFSSPLTSSPSSQY